MVSNPSGWSLECVSANLDVSTYEITEEGVTMGRGEFNSLILNSGNVSRRHLKVFLFEGVPYAQDQGSRNGIFVNGERVQEQQRLTPGDSVAVGEFTFEVRGPGGAKASAGGGGGKSKLPIMVGGALLVVLLAGGGYLMSRGGGDPAPNPQASLEPDTGSQGSENLFDFKEPAKKPDGSAAETKPAQQIDVASASLAQQGEGGGAQLSMDQRSKLVKEYLDRGLSHQDTGRLPEAMGYYQKAIQLDPGCALCRSRLERVEREIETTRQKRYDDALRYYNSLRYEEAVANWEVVLNLTTDKESEIYRRTVEYIEEARRKLEAGRL